MMTRLTLFALSMVCLANPVWGHSEFTNEPTGTTPLLDCNFSSVLTVPATNCNIENFYSAGLTTTDGTAPYSPSGVYRSTLNAGANTGGTQLNWWTPGLTTYREAFMGMWWRTNPEYQGRQVGNKTFFLRGPSMNGVWLWGNSNLNSSGGAPFIFSHNTGSLNNSHACSLDIGLACFPNVGSGMAFRGQWTKLEAYVKCSTTSISRDGVIRWWIGGTLAGNYTNINYCPSGFNEWVWSETWDGSVNPVPTVTWHHFLDHVYISVRNGGSTSNPDNPAGPPSAPTGIAVTPE